MKELQRTNTTHNLSNRQQLTVIVPACFDPIYLFILGSLAPTACNSRLILETLVVRCHGFGKTLPEIIILNGWKCAGASVALCDVWAVAFLERLNRSALYYHMYVF